MQQVLVAFDLTPVGRRVAERGQILAEESGCHLSLA